MEMARKKRDPKKAALAQAILDAYQPETAEDMNDALKDLFGPMIEAMLQGEVDHHLGYASTQIINRTFSCQIRFDHLLFELFRIFCVMWIGIEAACSL